MEYNLYTELIGNKVSKTDASNLCKVLSGLSIGPGEIKKVDNSFGYYSKDAYEKLDVSRTMCWLSKLEDGSSLISGYHIGEGHYQTNFDLYSTGDYTITIYDSKNIELFDQNDEMYIVTNHSNIFNQNESPKVPRCYHFSKESVGKLIELTKNNHDDCFGSLGVVEIELFAKYGLRPDVIVLLPSNLDPYAYVGNFVANKDLEKRGSKLGDKS